MNAGLSLRLTTLPLYVVRMLLGWIKVQSVQISHYVFAHFPLLMHT